MVEEKKEFLVIGAGLPRCGTLSTKTALELLLDGKCYHMKEAGKNASKDFKFWARMGANDVSTEELRDWITSRNYVGEVDYPSSAYYKEFMQAFPNAKVVLNVRDPVKWYQSVKNTLFEFYLCSKRFPTSVLPTGPMKLLDDLWFRGADGVVKTRDGLFGSVMAGEDEAVRFYNEWTKEVKNSVPADRLLIFDVKQGWQPLCNFLNLPVPEKPFPNVNDSQEMKKGTRIFRGVAWGIVLVGTVLLVGGAVLGWSLWGPQIVSLFA